MRDESRQTGCNGSQFQLCAGQPSGSEAAIHAMRNIFDADDTDAILLIYASNAFNSLNRAAALHNIRILCPTIATYVINTYRLPTRLFITAWWAGVKVVGRHNTGRPIIHGHLCSQCTTTHNKITPYNIH